MNSRHTIFPALRGSSKKMIPAANGRTIPPSIENTEYSDRFIFPSAVRLQNVKLIRYDAFEAMGGEMSYSILLTDAKKDGLLLTSIYGREESRCYAKDIKGGKSAYPLAEEEQKLL